MKTRNEYETKIAELEAKIAELEDMATRDPMTDAMNRRGAEQYIAAQSTRHTLTYIAIDLDGLKRSNELGHDVGDRLIKGAAECMRKCTRVVDCVARLGGDEFLVILRDCGILDAKRIAEQIKGAMSARDIHASFGIGYTREEADVRQVMAKNCRGAIVF